MIERIYVLLLLSASFGFSYLSAQGNHKVQTVVIDAGHGGKDPGCMGSFAKEKDICLSVSLALGELIQEHYPDVKVVYTRKKDEFIELHRRASIANQARADLFICIHVNAASPSAKGAETYVMGLHRSKDHLEVAKRENAAVSLESDYKKNYDGFDPNSTEDNILIAMMQSAYLDQSLSFAGYVQQHLSKHAGRFDRGVRQAGFLVLVKTTMPAVLIELGFASHIEEEKFLGSKSGQQRMAESIFLAFSDYKKLREGKSFLGPVKSFQASLSVQPPLREIPNSSNQSESENGSTHFFSIQLLSSRKKIALNDLRFLEIESVFEEAGVDGWFRYFSGKYEQKSEAQQHLSKIQSNGFSSAYLVGFTEGKRIAAAELQQILNKKN